MTGSETPSCFHCGEPCDQEPGLTVEREGRRLPVCCRGCQAVSELIFSSGLDRYYRFRETEAIKAPERLEEVELAWRAADQRPAMWGAQLPGGERELLLQTEGIHCAACAWLIRSHLEPLPGISRVQVDLGTGYTRIAWDPERLRLSRIARELARIGYIPHLPLAAEEERARLEERRGSMRRMGIAGLGMMQVMMYAVGLYAGEAFGITEGARRFLEWTSLLVSIPVVFYAGRPFFRGAVDSLRARRPGMDVPVALAIGVAFAASCLNFLRGEGEVYFDSVTMFVFFLSVARHVQLVQRQRNAAAGAALARLLPEWAERLDPARLAEPGERIPAVELLAGDRVRVRPGEPFPADGQLVSGSTEVNEALLTGESFPVRKGPGEAVIGGSVNRSQPVIVEVTAVGDDSALSALGRMLLRARAAGSRVGSLADRLAGAFVLAVLTIAALTGVLWWFQDPARVLPTVLAVLVVSCPCALSLATPAALAAASRALLRHGVLLTRGDALEALAVADVVVFDKTGTLTRGEPAVEAAHLNAARIASDPVSETVFDEREARSIAAALESQSSHPLARAFAGDAAGQAAEGEVRHHQGGLEGRVDGRTWRLGSSAFVGVREEDAAGVGTDDSAVWLGDERGWLAAFTLRDPLRSGGRSLVRALREDGIEVMILSGDGSAAVQAVAESLGIQRWEARLDPAAKMERVRDLQDAGRTVLMIGDGVNDAPVLATAAVSMTVQGATELAHSAADLILAGESLAPVETARRLARRARRLVRQNLAWAIAYNVLAIPLAVSGLLEPWMAALGMSASSLLVVGNAARVMRGASDAPPPTATWRTATQSG